MKLSNLIKNNFKIVDENILTNTSNNQPNVLAKPKSTITDITSEMNGIETAYWNHLNDLVLQKKIQRADFEPEKFKLAKKTYYTPDFRVIKNDGTVEFHETKGFWRDDARVKIKVAAKLHPYKFIAVTKKKGIWQYEYF